MRHCDGRVGQNPGRLSSDGCPVCGMDYVPDIPSNVRDHQRYHDEYVKGIRGGPLKSDHVVYQEGELRIVLITPVSPMVQRKRAEKVGRRANCETRYGFGVYDAYSRSGIHALVAYVRNRGVGILAFEKASHVCWETWEEYEAAEPARIPQKRGMWSVNFVWLLPKYQRRGIATLLHRVAAGHVGCESLKNLAFYTPLTKSGEKLLRSLCPEGFHIGK